MQGPQAGLIFRDSLLLPGCLICLPAKAADESSYGTNEAIGILNNRVNTLADMLKDFMKTQQRR